MSALKTLTNGIIKENPTLRLLNLLLNNLSSPSETLSTIMADAESFFGLADNEMCDDITMALVEIL